MTRKIDRSVLLKARQLHPNPWNPYANKPDRLQQAIGESIGEFSQIQDIVCRPHPEIEGEYQILDGEGRHRTFKPDEDVYAIVLHGLTDDQAKKVTIVMDETRATADKVQLSALLAELSENQDIEDLMIGLPYQESELSDLINLSAMGWDDDGGAEETAGDATDVDRIVGENDSGIEYKSRFAVAIECECEADQEDVFNRLSAEGYKCKVLVL